MLTKDLIIDNSNHLMLNVEELAKLFSDPKFSKMYLKDRTNIYYNFEYQKIICALKKAFKALYEEGVILPISTKTSLVVIIRDKLLEYPSVYIDIEDVQKIVIDSMKEIHLHFLAYLYKTYKTNKESERTHFENRAIKVVGQYLDKDSWEINENSNMEYSLQGLNVYLFTKFSKAFWKSILGDANFNYHTNGDLHIHDLYLLAPYCVGWDLKDLLLKGFSGVSSKVVCAPPKHFDSACGQIVNFLYTLQGEAAGAVAFSNVDTLLAPYIHRDGLLNNRKRLFQDVQKLIYNLNVPTRVGFQCLSEDTEIYTEAGWKLYNQITLGENIHVFDMETRTFKTDTVTGISVNLHQGSMYNFVSPNSDELVTQTHRCIRHHVHNDILSFKEASKALNEIVSDNDSSILCASFVNEDLSFTSEKITSTSFIKDYEGIVWCPTTDTGTVIARRNGKIFITGNSPFTNFSLDLQCPNHMKDEPVIIDGKYDETLTYGECQKSMDAFNDAFCEVFTKGDKNKKIFTFPIPTYSIGKDFDWEKKEHDSLWEMTSKYGIPYFANYINSDMSPEDSRSMCCRLRLDLKQLRKRGGGLFGAGALTGSIGVITINLPRIGHQTNTKEEFFDRLRHLIEIASDTLSCKVVFIEEMTEKGFFPYSKYFLSSVKEGQGRYWANHFLTIATLGMHEACQNFFKDPAGIESDQGQSFTIEVMDFMNTCLIELQEKTGQLYNLEAAPAEGTASKMMHKDRQVYPEMYCFSLSDNMQYTNSTNLPVDTEKDIYQAIDHQSEIQAKYTGGSVLHIFLNQAIHDPEVTKQLVRRLLTNYKVPYISITPTFSICEKHGMLPGCVDKCPICQKEVLNYSRVVG